MSDMLLYFLVAIIVGFVTSGLNIKFDRFFLLILLISILHMSVFDSVNIFLWVILFGTLYILISNFEAIKSMPKKQKILRLSVIPVLTLIASFVGSYLFFISPEKVLLISLGILALLYGLRLIFIHFNQEDKTQLEGKPIFQKICLILGPMVSGLSLGFIGTSLKPLKVPFGVKIGKMNLKQVYFGNVITAFFGSLFAIFWHNTIFITSTSSSITYLIYGFLLWISIHVISKLTDLFFKDGWKKIFQILIGIILLIISIKFISS